MLVAVGDHRSAPVPAPPAHDVHRGGEEGVGGAHDGADVHVVLEILDRHVERVAALVQLGADRLEREVAVRVDHVAAIAVFEKLRVVARILRPRALPRPDAVAALAPFGGAFS